MFTIIGGDGKEYGPVTTEQIRGWITAGRANLDTKAKAVGSEEWRRLGDFPEFGGGGGLPPALATLPRPAENQAALAHPGMRLVAVLIDGVIASLALVPGIFFIGAQFVRLMAEASQGQQPDFGDVDQNRLILGVGLCAVFILALAVVQIVMLSLRGQTIGKRLCGLRIMRVDGSKAGFVHAFLLRAMVPGIIGGVPIAGPIFSLVDICFIFREDRRCIHDLIAGTRVVKVSP